MACSKGYCKRSISYRGRKDSQVKINGQRLEIAEVEHHLSIHPAVQHVAVLKPASATFDHRLMAVCTFRGIGESPDLGESEYRILSGNEDLVIGMAVNLQSFLAKRIPHFAILSLFLCVNRMPMSESKKLDWREILRWANEVLDEQPELVYDNTFAPVDSSTTALTSTETAICQICADVLRRPIDGISVHKSFASQGGDSLRAIRVVRLAKRRGLEITMADLLQSRTLRVVAECADDRGVIATAANEEDNADPFDLAPIQAAFLAQARYKEDESAEACVLDVERYISFQQIEDATAALCSRHAILRVVFTKSCDGFWQNNISPTARYSVRLRHVDSFLTINKFADFVAHIKLETPRVAWLEGPLLAVDLVEVKSTGQQRLYISAHRLIADSPSLRTIAVEVEEHLENGRFTLPPPLLFPTWLKRVQDLQISTVNSGARMISITQSRTPLLAVFRCRSLLAPLCLGVPTVHIERRPQISWLLPLCYRRKKSSRTTVRFCLSLKTKTGLPRTPHRTHAARLGYSKPFVNSF